MYKIYFKNTFILALIIDTKVAKTIASFFVLKALNIYKKSNFSYCNFNK